MDELDYFDAILNVIAKELPFKAEEEVDRIQSSRLMIENVIRMRLVADPDTMLDEQRTLKKRCCELLCHTYQLDARKKEKDQDFGKQLIRNLILMALITELEKLFFFFINFSQISMKDL